MIIPRVAQKGVIGRAEDKKGLESAPRFLLPIGNTLLIAGKGASPENCSLIQFSYYYYCQS
jgi:hypothetical protein